MTLKTYEGIKVVLDHFKLDFDSKKGLEIAFAYLASEIDTLKEQNATNKSVLVSDAPPTSEASPATFTSREADRK